MKVLRHGHPSFPARKSGPPALLSASSQGALLGGEEKRPSRKERGQRWPSSLPYHVDLQTDPARGLGHAASFATLCSLHGLSRRVHNTS